MRVTLPHGDEGSASSAAGVLVVGGVVYLMAEALAMALVAYVLGLVVISLLGVWLLGGTVYGAATGSWRPILAPLEAIGSLILVVFGGLAVVTAGVWLFAGIIWLLAKLLGA